MIKRRAKVAGLPAACNHTFRVTGITACRKDGGSLGYVGKPSLRAQA
jgi:hypothetical protein